MKYTLAFPDPADLDLAQDGRIILRLEKPAMTPCNDWSSTARKCEMSAYLLIIYKPRKSVSASLT